MELPKELSHIGGTIAVLSIDGNMMGRMFTQTTTPAEYSFKSKTFDIRFKKILKETIADFSRKHHKHPNLIQHDVFIGVDVIYAGGDDVLIIMNAKAALGFARMLIRNISAEFRFQPDHHPNYSTSTVTICVGIAFADCKFPIYFLIDRSEELLDDAKQGFRRAVKQNELNLFKLTEGAISFASITSSMPGEQRHIFVLPSDENGLEDESDLVGIISHIEDVQLKDYPRSMVSMIINCSERFEDRLNLVKHLYSRLGEKELFDEASRIAKRGTPMELCHEVCEILAEKKKVRDGLKEAIPMVWVGDGE